MMTLRLSNPTKQKLQELLQRADATEDLKRFKRIQTLVLCHEGHSLPEIAAYFRVTRSAVYQWGKDFLLEGLASLLPRGHRREPRPRLHKAHRRRLAQIIDQGPQAYALDIGVWTAGRLQGVIQQELGVHYQAQYLCALLNQLGFSYQKARFASAP